MNGMKSLLLLFLCFCFGVTLTQAQVDRPSSAREELDRGVTAFRNSNYDEAIEHFNNAVHLDPELKVARLYLATAHAQYYVPGVDTAENVSHATHALEEYGLVLRNDPNNKSVVKGIAFLNMQLKRFDEARNSYALAAKIDPSDPESFYSIGVIDWSIVYRDMTETKTRLKLKPEQTLISSPACPDLRAGHLVDVENGITMLTHAIDLRKNYHDAMAYLNLLYRMRAELQCGDQAAYAADVRNANQWTDLAMGTRKKNSAAEAKKTQEPETRSPQ
jgi:tetratricopeptide (TPR) repeat protein